MHPTDIAFLKKENEHLFKEIMKLKKENEELKKKITYLENEIDLLIRERLLDD